LAGEEIGRGEKKRLFEIHPTNLLNKGEKGSFWGGRGGGGGVLGEGGHYGGGSLPARGELRREKGYCG